MSTMNVDYLNKDLLEYELRVRGVKGVTTVEEMRRTLRFMLKLEKEGKLLSITSPSKADPTEELSRVEALVNEVVQAVKTVEGQTKHRPYKKLDTLLTHASNRLERIATSDEELLSKRSTLLRAVVDAWKLLEERVGVPEDAGAQAAAGPSQITAETEQETPVSRHIQEMRGQLPPGIQLSPADADSRPIHVRRHYVPVKDWGLKISGDTRSQSVYAFLEDVELYCRARGTSSSELLDGALDLFTGTALLWFKAVRREIRSWDELVVLLKEEYEEYDYEERLLAEMKARTQGPEEKFGTYLAVMKTYFARMPRPMSEDMKLKILRRNLAPYYYDRLRAYDPQSVEQLLQIGRQLQRDKIHMEQYRPPPQTRKNLLEPDLACSGGRREEVRVNSLQTPQDTRTNPPRFGGHPTKMAEKAPPDGKKGGWNHPIVCWHCHKEGHISPQCPERKSRCCPKCKEVRPKTGPCPKCKSLNSRADHEGRV